MLPQSIISERDFIVTSQQISVCQKPFTPTTPKIQDAFHEFL